MWLEEADLVVGAEIADGSFTVVHTAEYKGEPVCVKGFHDIIDPAIVRAAPDSDVRTRFMAELGEALAELCALNHSNVTSCRGVCLDAVTRFPKWIVVELAEQSLAGYVRRLRGGGLSLRQLLAIASDVAAGLAYLHSRRVAVIHGDIRGRNILLCTQPDGTLRLRLNDSTLQRMAIAGGSPLPRLGGYQFYQAPELAGPDSTPTPLVDVYSVGVLCAETILAYVRLNSGENLIPNPQQVFGLTGRPAMVQRACDLLTPVCPPLAKLLSACCAEDPALRPDSASLSGVLAGIMDTLPPEEPARPPRPRALSTAHPAVDVALLCDLLDELAVDDEIVAAARNWLSEEARGAEAALEWLAVHGVTSKQVARLKVKLDQAPPPAPTLTSAAASSTSSYDSHRSLASRAPSPLQLSKNASTSSTSSAGSFQGLTTIPSAALTLADVIGQGHFGAVFRGTYSGAPVAVKVLKGEGMTPADEASIASELRLLAAVPPHPNIVRALGVCTVAGGRVGIVMELCEGGNLRAFIDAIPKKPLEPAFLAHILLQCAHGVAHLHNSGIGHRDIRGPNFLVAGVGSGGLKVQISDFGLSHVLPQGGAGTTYTTIGPIAWRAPETFTGGGRQVFATSTDVYMFGCFLLEMLTGKDPWWWLDRESLFIQRVKAVSSPLADAQAAGVYATLLPPGPVATGLEELIARCVQPAPVDRPDMPAVVSVLQSLAVSASSSPLASPLLSVSPPSSALRYSDALAVAPADAPPPYSTLDIVYKVLNSWYNVGLAVTPDARHMVVTNKDRVSVFSLPSGEEAVVLTRKGAGKGEFRDSRGVCVSASGTSFLVAEDFNQRVQEVSLAGAHMRFMCVGKGQLEGVAAQGPWIAVGKDIRASPHRVLLLEEASGRVVRGFGVLGAGPQEMRCCPSLAFVDGQLIVADADNRRVSVWSLEGEFISDLAAPDMQWPCGIAVDPEGRVAIVDRDDALPCVRLYAPGLAACTHSVDVGGTVAMPRAVAFAQSRMYVLDKSSRNVAVFK